VSSHALSLIAQMTSFSPIWQVDRSREISWWRSISFSAVTRRLPTVLKAMKLLGYSTLPRLWRDTGTSCAAILDQLGRSCRYWIAYILTIGRYIDGVIKSEYFTLPANYTYHRLRTKVDPELVSFFEGFEYRWDIIDRIDMAVRGAIQALGTGQPVNPGWRRLICCAIWGNPVDAYKWYEYQLQEEYLPHRYLPEHVVLGHLPKFAGEAAAQPSSRNTSKRHMQVRYRMARANDEGIGVYLK
jgi:hypothetical protein